MSVPYAEVIGDPVAHSKSPLIHQFWLAKLGIEAEYRACHVRAEELAKYFTQRRGDAAWRGCNVTVPHKLAALALAERVSGEARRIGAANCIAPADDGTLTASNTDAAGFAEPLAELPLGGQRAVVVGAGGAARAVLAALAGRGVRDVTLLNRSQDKAAGLLSASGMAGIAAPVDAPLPPDCALLVNASTLGMQGQPPLQLDLSPLPPTAMVYDIVYAPLETGLLRAARERGLRTLDGLAMLIGQAAAAFALFFGRPAPREHDAELRGLLTA